MRYLTFIIIILIGALTGISNIVIAEDRMGEMQWNTDLYGMDYAGIDLATSDPTLCEELCASDPKCLAWTYIKPNTVQGPNPRCWLKHSISPSSQSSHCVSGTKILKSRIKMIPQGVPTRW